MNKNWKILSVLGAALVVMVAMPISAITITDNGGFTPLQTPLILHDDSNGGLLPSVLACSTSKLAGSLQNKSTLAISGYLALDPVVVGSLVMPKGKALRLATLCQSRSINRSVNKTQTVSWWSVWRSYS